VTFGVREETQRAELVTDTLDAVHAQVEAERGHMALVLDEFQRVHEWGGEDAEWALKSVLETHSALSYVLAGSQRHLIEAMMTRKGRALWKQADTLAIEAIDPQEMAEWIHQEAARTRVDLTLDASDEVVRLAGPRTRDIVQLAREVWFEGLSAALGDQSAGTRLVRQARDRLVDVQAALYSAIWRERSAVEQRIMRAVLLEPNVALTSTPALKRYQLGPKSTVQQAIGRLVEGEYLVALPGVGYAFDDPFFRHWIARHVLPDLGFLGPG
jgi:hypothetical protein